MADTYLTRAVGSTGNQKIWTWSAWIKRGTIPTSGNQQFLFSANNTSNYTSMFFDNSTNRFNWYNYSGGYTDRLETTARFRDSAAWYHFVVQYDSTQSTEANRVKLYINGSQITDFATANYPTLNYDSWMNLSGYNNIVGRQQAGDSAVFDGYMSEVHLTDGTSYAASTFGETDTSGVWKPKVGPTVTYGTNGFYLKFANSGAMGTDSSGQSNTFSVGGGTVRQVPDSPTNVFPTLNPLVAVSPIPTLSQGNLESTPSGNGNHTTGATQFIPEGSGKWYAETVLTYVSEQSGAFTIQDPNNIKDSIASYSGQYSVLWQASGTDYYATHDGSSATNSTNATISVGDIFQIAYDATNGKVWFGRNNTWITGNPSTDTTPTYSSITGDKVFTTTGYRASSGSSYTAQLVNFGQDSSFGGNKTAQNNADANGKGDFYYAPPTGFLALCTDNLSSELTIPINKGADNFNPVLYTGNGTSQTITGVGFQPDFLWIKNREQTDWHNLINSTVGATKRLSSNNTNEENTNAQNVSAFASDGFSVGNDHNTNANGENYVSWNWKAGSTAPANTYAVKVVSDTGNKYRFDDYGTSAITLELQEGGTFTFDQSDASNAGHPLRFSSTADGTHGGGSEYTTGVTTTGTPGQAGAKTVITVAGSAPTLYYYCSVHSGMGGQANTGSLFGFTNVKGTLQGVVSPNSTAGFSIVTYTGTGSAATVGHGLGVAPSAIIGRSRTNSGYNWGVWHESLQSLYGNNAWIQLNTTSAYTTQYDVFNPENNTTSVIGLGSEATMNNSGSNYVAYCFAEIEGYSKIDSYTGNGDANGTFVYTGFTPAWVMYKNSSSAADWLIYDTKRIHSGTQLDYLEPNTSDAEGFLAIDVLSNGFKLREASGDNFNTSGDTYIFMAFAENPFVSSGGTPVTAR